LDVFKHLMDLSWFIDKLNGNLSSKYFSPSTKPNGILKI